MVRILGLLCEPYLCSELDINPSGEYPGEFGYISIAGTCLVGFGF